MVVGERWLALNLEVFVDDKLVTSEAASETASRRTPTESELSVALGYITSPCERARAEYAQDVIAIALDSIVSGMGQEARWVMGDVFERIIRNGLPGGGQALCLHPPDGHERGSRCEERSTETCRAGESLPA